MEEVSRTYCAWVARNKQGTLMLFDKKPVRFKWFGGWSQCLVNLNPRDFPDVTWESGPHKVELKMRLTNE
jgi:hypothetical protein